MGHNLYLTVQRHIVGSGALFKRLTVPELILHLSMSLEIHPH